MCKENEDDQRGAVSSVGVRAEKIWKLEDESRKWRSRRELATIIAVIFLLAAALGN
jgi:hypothetical protein